MNTDFGRRLIAGWMSMWLFASGVALADDSNAKPDQVLTLEQAVALTLARNPGLRTFGYQVEAQRGVIKQAGLKPNPEVSLLLENIAGTGEFNAVDSAEATLSIGWILERGRRARRVDAANAGLSTLRAEAEIGRATAAAETSRLFIDGLTIQARLERLEAATALAERTVSAVRKRVDAGGSPMAELARAEADLARANLDVEDARHMMATAERRLAAQWGELRPQFDRLGGEITRLPEAGGFAELQASIERNPEWLRSLTESDLRRAELQLERARGKPNWRVSAGLRQHQFENDVALVAGITVPFGWHDRNQGNIARANANVARSEVEREALRVRLDTQLFALHQELLHARHQSEVLSTEIIPRIEVAVAETRNSFERGRYRYLELQLVQAELLQAQLALIDAAASAHRNAIEIERLTGSMLARSAGDQS